MVEDIRLNNWAFIEDNEERDKFLYSKSMKLQNIVEEISSKKKTEVVSCLLPRKDAGSDFLHTTLVAGFARELDSGVFTKDFLQHVSNSNQDFKRMARAFLKSQLRRELNCLIRKCMVGTVNIRSPFYSSTSLNRDSSIAFFISTLYTITRPDWEFPYRKHEGG